MFPGVTPAARVIETVTVGAWVGGEAVPGWVAASGGEGCAVDEPVAVVVAALVAAARVLVAVGGGTVAVGAPPWGSCPQIWANVMSCGAGAEFGPPRPHFQP